VTGDFGVCGSFTECRDKEFGPAVHAFCVAFRPPGVRGYVQGFILSGWVPEAAPGICDGSISGDEAQSVVLFSCE
jgi:hypothetical protein